MRARGCALVLAAALTACGRVPVAQGPSILTLSVHKLESGAKPSPLLEVRAGQVRAIIPDTWEARLLPRGAYPREGFVASPRIEDWRHGSGPTQGLEAFWVDAGKMRIPSDYYYLAAQKPLLDYMVEKGVCRRERQQVFANHPPDFTGKTFSRSDYVASASGTCHTDGRPTRWAYVVAAPGFGPARQVGIPTSGLYVVIAVVSGAKSEFLLKQILRGARFGNTSISEIIQAAGGQTR